MFHLRDLYPDILGVSTNEMSIPERAEQAAVDYQADAKAPQITGKAGNIWMGLLVILVLLWLFNLI